MRVDPSLHIPTSDTTAEQWVIWHKSLRKWFSKNEANDIWLRFWNQRAGAGSSADLHSLRSYMETQGVNITSNLAGDIADTTMDVIDWTVGTINWARGLAIGGIIIGFGLIAFYVIYSTMQGRTAGEIAADAATIGRGRRLRKAAVRSTMAKQSVPRQPSMPRPRTIKPKPPVIDSFDGIDFTAGSTPKRLT